MKAITLWQPWASMCVIPRPCDTCDDDGEVVVGWSAEAYENVEGPCPDCRPLKTIETRSWPAPKSVIGQRIAIHAAARTAGWGRRGTRTDIGPFEVEYDASGLLLRGPIAWPYRLPLGAVVGTAVLADCVPMESLAPGDPEPGTLDHGRVLYILPDGDELRIVDRFADTDPADLWGEDVTDQLPFGHFEQGRWAWLLTAAERFAETIPATGRQGIWNWEAP